MFKSFQIEYIQNKIKSLGKTSVVVEGIKDKLVLARLEFENVFDISGNTLYNVVNQIKKFGYSSAVILTDFDGEGKKKAKLLTKLFHAHGIKTHSFIRNKFGQLLKIHKIEELSSFTKLMEDDYYGKTCSINDKIFDRSRFFCRRNNRKA